MCLSFIGAFIMQFIKTGGPLTINSPLGIFLPMYYYHYFYSGFLVYKYKEKIILNIKKILVDYNYIIYYIMSLYKILITYCSIFIYTTITDISQQFLFY